MSDQQKAIQALQRAVKALPNLRVGQIIANALFAAKVSTDPFYVSDDLLAAALDAYRESVR